MPAGIGDHPLQSRGGNNTSPGPITLFNGVKGAGKIVKIQAPGDNVLVEGLKNKVRLVGVIAMRTLGVMYNRSGGPVDHSDYFIDAQGNEILLGSSTLLDGNADAIPTPNPACAVFGLVEGEKVVTRITLGDPSAGNGVVFIPIATHDAENAISERIRIQNTYRKIIAAPPPGKTWQMPVTSSYPCGASIVAMNFDADPHTFNCYLVDGQGNSVLLSAGDVVGPNAAANIFTDTIQSHMFPYPYHLEVQEVSGNPIGNLYVATMFAEFDLPKDLG